MLGNITSLRPVWAIRDLVSITPPFQKKSATACSPSTQETKAGGLQVQGLARILSKFWTCLSYKKNPYLKFYF